MDTKPMRVLVVEDDPDTALSLSTLLRMDGYEVEIASDGETAVAAAQMSYPDVVLLDIGLPRMNGYEVARRIMEQPAPKRPLLVAVTAYGDKQARRRSQEVGIDLHLVKPVEPDALERLLLRFHRVIYS
jgi:CheY-like chemotaxis protein